uniref:Uncharacterized protein n=1 Tax=Daphnia galeata TaxID=27404 RepID=A0A8J2RVA2_9CRUS|nr:unnamed protein product [Daphnia galeata]
MEEMMSYVSVRMKTILIVILYGGGPLRKIGTNQLTRLKLYRNPSAMTFRFITTFRAQFSSSTHRSALVNPVNLNKVFPCMTENHKSLSYFESTRKINFHSRSTRSLRITGTSKRKFDHFVRIIYFSNRRGLFPMLRKFSIASPWSLKLSSSDSSHFYRGSIDDLCHLLLCSSFRCFQINSIIEGKE